ncbi:MAG: hypothetical protein ABFS34_07875 [Gemmatimonadota bacterium]
MTVRTHGILAVCVLLLIPIGVTAQDDDDDEGPEIRYLTTSQFHLAYGDDRQAVMWWVDSVSVPINEMDPNVLWSRVAVHNYGPNGGDVVFMSEYADWASINAPCEPCDEWFEERQPEEGTPEREEWDANLATFLKYYSTHEDQIFSINMDRAK